MDPRQLERIVVGERERALEPHGAARVLAAQELDVAELALRRRRGASIPDRLGGAHRPVQRGRPVLVPPLGPVDERRAPAEQRGGLHRGLARGRRRRRGVAKLAEPAVEGAGRDRRLAGLQERLGGGATAGGRLGPRLHAGRAIELGRDVDPELPLEQVDGCRQLSLDGDLVARRRERADQQHVRVLAQRIGAEQAGGERHGPARVAGGQRPQRPLPQDGAAEPLEAASLAEQPGIEPRAGLDVDPLQQLPAQTGQLDGGRRGPLEQHGHVQRRAARQPEADRRAAADGLGPAEESAQLRQVPPQGVRRVLGLREQQRRKLLASWRPLREGQVRENGPDLLAPWRRVDDPLPGDERRSEQLGDDGHPAILTRLLTRPPATVRPEEPDRGNR